MKCPNWLYKRALRRGHLPRWVRWIWKASHWCPEMDDLLVIDNLEDCFCGYAQQPKVTCSNCNQSIEARYIRSKGCLDCIPPEWLDTVTESDIDELLDRLENNEIVE